MPRQLADELLDRVDAVWNMYGPTETTVWSSAWRVQRSCDIVIGKPIANTQLYVLDANLSPVPVGFTGELCIGGAGVARGYCKDPAQTASRFVPNPIHSGVMYRTGDVACFREPGMISVLGRMDGQIKLRGFRIELGDIEAAIRSHSDVSNAVVVLRDGRLAAYYTRSPVLPGREVPDKALFGPLVRSWVEDRLPRYMVPDFFIELEEFQLTPNAKIDRKALPKPKDAPLEPAALPANELEQQILDIWSSVLGRENIGVSDNFFNAGGDSLRVIAVQAKLQELLGRRIAITALYEFLTIKELAAYLAGQT